MISDELFKSTFKYLIMPLLIREILVLINKNNSCNKDNQYIQIDNNQLLDYLNNFK